MSRLNPWAIYDKYGQIHYIHLHENEDACWRAYTNNPNGAAALKAHGFRASWVTVDVYQGVPVL